MGFSFKGLSVNDLKKHPSLIPIIVLIGCASAGATLYTIRLATKSPEVVWTRRNPEPWNEYRDKQYKFLAIEQDCEKEDASKAPKIEEILKS